MPSASVYDMDGQVVREENLDGYVFGSPVNTAVLHQVVTAQLINRRQGTASTKTRAMVSGGNSKPYRQKGTGRARQGSTRAPHFRGGGAVFGPRPHSYDRKLPRKIKRIAIRSALSDKARNGRILLMDDLNFEQPRTKDMLALLEKLPLEGRHVLVLMPEHNPNVFLSARNIHRVRMGNVAATNVVELLKYDDLLLPVSAAQRLVELFGQDADDAIQMRRHPRVVLRRKAREAARAAQRTAGAIPAAAATPTTTRRARTTTATATAESATTQPETPSAGGNTSPRTRRSRTQEE